MSGAAAGEGMPRGPLVFVSHAGPDTGWAEWVAWHLDKAGYQVELDRWDWETGSDFVLKMARALEVADAVVAVWSAAYFEEGRFTEEEWSTAVAARDRLVPLRVEQVTPPKLLGRLIYQDLFGKPEEQARRTLLEAMRPPGRPTSAPAFPGGVSAAPAGAPRLPGVLPPVWNVPPRSPAFVGRDQMLANLRTLLRTESSSRVAVQALHGMGGVGKTLLAIEFAHRFSGDYNLVWWIDAEQMATIGDRYTTLAIKLGLVQPDSDVPTALDAVRDHLRQISRWLVIFDNAEDPAALRAWLPDGPGRTLVTSRNPVWSGIAAVREVDVFARPESVKLLQEQAPTLTEADANAIADAVGDLPLALAQAAGVISSGLTAAEYLAAVRDEVSELMKLGVPATYPASLAATVRVALGRVDKTNPAAGELARVYAFLAAEPIPSEWLTKTAAATPDALPDRLAEAASSSLRVNQARTALIQRGLAKHSPTGLVLHRLTTAIIRASITGARIAGYRRAAEAVLVAAHPGDESEPATWPQWAILLPHLQELPRDTDNPAVRDLAHDAAWYLINSGQYTAARDYTAPLYQHWRTTLDRDEAAMVRAANVLAVALRAVGEVQAARQQFEDLVAGTRRQFGDDQPNTLASASSLANALRGLGEVQAARELDEDILSRRRRVLGENHPDTLASAGNLALDLRQLGEVQAARELDEDILSRRRRVLGENHPDTLASAGNLALDLRQLGEVQAARKLNEDTLARRRRVLGEDHPDTLSSASNLAVDLSELGEPQPARELDEDTVIRMRRILGENNPSTLKLQARLKSYDDNSEE